MFSPPPPTALSMARWILSLGIDCALAAMMAARSRGLWSGSGMPELGRDGDFAGELGEQLGAHRIDAPLPVHDVLELTVAGHGSPGGGSNSGGTAHVQAVLRICPIVGREWIASDVRPPAPARCASARPLAFVSTNTPHSVAGPWRGEKRLLGILRVKRCSGSNFSMPMTES